MAYPASGVSGAAVAAAAMTSDKARKDSKWEILANLENGTKYGIDPKSMEGFLSKRRKWPLKGWHKRYFILDKGILTYGKSPQDIKRGRTHGRIDVGLAVVSAKTEHLRIDIDDEEFIHHLKAGNLESFGLWLEQLQQHRFFQQNLLNETPAVVAAPEAATPLRSPDDASPRGGSLNRGMRLANPTSKGLQELGLMDERMTEQLLSIQQHAVTLGLVAQKLEDEVNAGQRGSTKQKLFGTFRKKNKVPETVDGGGGRDDEDLRPASMPVDGGAQAQRSVSNSKASLTSTLSFNESLSCYPTRDELIAISQDLQQEISSLLRNYSADRDRLKSALVEAQQQEMLQQKTSTLGAGSGNVSLINALRTSLNSALQQNAHLKDKLEKIHAESSFSELPPVSFL